MIVQNTMCNCGKCYSNVKKRFLFALRRIRYNTIQMQRRILKLNSQNFISNGDNFIIYWDIALGKFVFYKPIWIKGPLIKDSIDYIQQNKQICTLLHTQKSDFLVLSKPESLRPRDGLNLFNTHIENLLLTSDITPPHSISLDR